MCPQGFCKKERDPSSAMLAAFREYTVRNVNYETIKRNLKGFPYPLVWSNLIAPRPVIEGGDSRDLVEIS